MKEYRLRAVFDCEYKKFLAMDETFDIHQRLGYVSDLQAWHANPAVACTGIPAATLKKKNEQKSPEMTIPTGIVGDAIYTTYVCTLHYRSRLLGFGLTEKQAEDMIIKACIFCLPRLGQHERKKGKRLSGKEKKSLILLYCIKYFYEEHHISLLKTTL